MMGDRGNVLPNNLPPRGLSRAQAAAYIGVSSPLFDEMVRDGRMPKPMRINSRAVWDRVRLDAAFAELSDGAERVDPWGNVAV
jgi:predicted DNA-binding transcriptional regulator AlpA